MPPPGAPVNTPPVCPRHRDRVAYVSCQRCGRPTCPDCQRPAPVGIQCVDCVAQAARSAPKVTSRFGAPAGVGARPVVSLTLMAVCLLVYAAQQVDFGVTQRLWFAPVQATTEPWRMLTAAFVHSPSSLLHIAFNMYALFVVGGYLEPLLGKVRFALLYLISALGGSVGYVVLATVPDGWRTPTVGASGAVFGLFAAMLVLNWHLERQTAGIVVLLVLNGAIGFVIPGIAWQAHLGGALTGALLAGLLALTSSRGRDKAAVRRRAWQWPGYAVVVLLLLLLAGWRIGAVQGLTVPVIG